MFRFSEWRLITNTNKKDVWFYREIQRKFEKKHGKGYLSISFTARGMGGFLVPDSVGIWQRFTSEMWDTYHEIEKEVEKRKPKYGSFYYDYPCTFLGRHEAYGKTYDIYHTRTFEGYLLLFRYGYGSYHFDGVHIHTCEEGKDDMNDVYGEGYRRAVKKGLPLTNEVKEVA